MITVNSEVIKEILGSTGLQFIERQIRDTASGDLNRLDVNANTADSGFLRMSIHLKQCCAEVSIGIMSKADFDMIKNLHVALCKKWALDGFLTNCQSLNLDILVSGFLKNLRGIIQFYDQIENKTGQVPGDSRFSFVIHNAVNINAVSTKEIFSDTDLMPESFCFSGNINEQFVCTWLRLPINNVLKNKGIESNSVLYLFDTLDAVLNEDVEKAYGRAKVYYANNPSLSTDPVYSVAAYLICDYVLP